MYPKDGMRAYSINPRNAGKKKNKDKKKKKRHERAGARTMDPMTTAKLGDGE